MCADSYCYYTSILKVNLFSLQAEADAYKIMGEKKFYHQIKEDERLFQKLKITDDKNIVTLKDYMQVRNLDLDIESKQQQNKPCDPIFQEVTIIHQFIVVKYTQYKMCYFIFSDLLLFYFYTRKDNNKK